MSAYICGDKTINDFLSLISTNKDFSHQRGLILERHGYDLEKESGRQAFGQACVQLNRAAVNARYREKEKVEAFTLIYLPTSPIQALKSLRCLIYQCSEGDVPEEPLYKTLDEIGATIALNICRSLPEWERADWG